MLRHMPFELRIANGQYRLRRRAGPAGVAADVLW